MGSTEADRKSHEIDWTGCELVERIAGKVSGKPIVRGTRILANTIVQDAELGSSLEEIHENYPDLPISTIQQLFQQPASSDERSPAGELMGRTGCESLW